MLLAPAAASAAAAHTASKSAPRSTAARAHAAMVLPFIENDYTKAVAQARARKLPIFVEAWAPW